MKPAPFLYFAPHSVEEALALLTEHGDDAKVLAGGQSLVPTMNFRLAQPAVLVDLNRVEGISEIGSTSDGGIRIGAMVRQRRVETSSLVARDAPLVHSTMPFIAHPQIRNRGTFGGSLAHADPAAELPAVCLALEARFRVRSQSGERLLEASQFFTGLFSTDLGSDELLVEVELPPPVARSGWSFQEVSRRQGDFALVGVAVTVTLTPAGRCEAARIVLLSVGEGPVEAKGGAAILVGEELGEDVCAAAAEAVASGDIDPPSDIHASSDFRRHLAGVLTRRTLAEAARRVG